MAITEKHVLGEPPSNRLDGWRGFRAGRWVQDVDVNDFLTLNLTPYEGDERFLAAPTTATKSLWNIVLDLMKQERDNGGVLDVDTNTVSTIVSHEPGAWKPRTCLVRSAI